MFKQFLNLSLIAIAAVSFTACGGGSETSTTTPEATTTPETTPEPVVEETPEPVENTTEELVATQEITVDATGNTMNEMAYSPAEIKLPAYTVVKVNFNNTATEAGMIHNFVLINTADADAIREAGMAAGGDANFSPTDDRIIAQSKMLNPGESDAVTFETPEPGEYLVICTYPGHTAMQAKVIIE